MNLLMVVSREGSYFDSALTISATLDPGKARMRNMSLSFSSVNLLHTFLTSSSEGRKLSGLVLLIISNLLGCLA